MRIRPPARRDPVTASGSIATRWDSLPDVTATPEADAAVAREARGIATAADTAAAFVSTGDGSWVWQSPLPQGNRINDVHVFNADHLLAVGDHGLLLVDGRAMDGGPLPDFLDEPAAAATRLFVEGRLGAGASR
mgnify:CR=1 FL=1